MDMRASVKQLYKIECYDRHGRLKWEEEFDNLVVTAGLNKYLDATLKTGLAAPLWYVGLKDTGTPDPADTMASHASWATITPYSNATDPAWTPGTISGGSVDNSASKAVFNINATDDIYGAFLKDNNTKGGSTGTLLGVGDFAGPRSVESGDTLNVTVTCSIAAA
ncbi:MAG: hypothetical protein A2Y80_08875 [Deltaproteobacteria bacterium RBG_13_58_19]|nr:MAG: hypothetical protein A2Y80_08875 [Deltaproteobacteria bacterium RBG_13_58_19]